MSIPQQPELAIESEEARKQVFNILYVILNPNSQLGPSGRLKLIYLKNICLFIFSISNFLLFRKNSPGEERNRSFEICREEGEKRIK